jgi:hypothetical protein
MAHRFLTIIRSGGCGSRSKMGCPPYLRIILCTGTSSPSETALPHCQTIIRFRRSGEGGSTSRRMMSQTSRRPKGRRANSTHLWCTDHSSRILPPSLVTLHSSLSATAFQTARFQRCPGTQATKASSVIDGLGDEKKCEKARACSRIPDKLEDLALDCGLNRENQAGLSLWLAMSCTVTAGWR